MLLFNPICTVLYFVVMGIDIAVFFLLIHLIVTKWNIQWLAPFEKIGRDIVARVTATVGGIISRKSHQRLSTKGAVFASIVILTTTRFGLVLLMKCTV